MTDIRYERNRMGLTNPRQEDRAVMIESSDAPAPGEESVGPTMFDMVVELRRAREVSQFLLSQATNLLKQRTIIAKSAGQTSAAGLLDLDLYTVPLEFQLYVTRWNVEAVGFNPGVPYTNALGQLILYSGTDFGVGSMIDFLPNPPAANGAILPASQSDGKDSAALFRGGETVSIRLVNGPATTAVYARIQGIQEAV